MAHNPFAAVLERRAYDFGRMESNVRSALNQLEHGNTELALQSLRRAVEIAEARA